MNQNWRSILDDFPALLWTAGFNGDRIALNQAWLKFTGLRLEQALGDGWVNAVHPEDAAALRQAWTAAMSARIAFTAEYRLLRSDGAYCWIESRAQPMLDTAGQQTGWSGADTDINGRKALEERNNIQAKLLAGVQDAVIVLDENLHPSYLNPAAERLFRWTAADLLESSSRDLMPVEFLNTDRDQAMQALQAGSIFEGEVAFRRKDGSRFEARARAQALDSPDGAFHGMVASLRDISEQRLDRQRIQEALAFNQAIVESAQVGIIVYETTGQCRMVNPAACRIVGASREALLEQNFHTINTWKSFGLYDAALQVLQTARPVDMQFRGVSTFGKEIWLNAILSPVTIGGAPHLLLMFQDDTRRQQAEAALQTLNEQLEQRVQERTALVQDLYDNAPIGYHSLDPNGIFRMINRTELDWLGYSREEVVGKLNIADLLTPESLETFHRNFPVFRQQGWIKNLDFDLRRKDGSLLPVVVSATAIYDTEGQYLLSRSTVFDNTDRKKAQEALRQNRDALAGANLALEKALHARDEFMAAVSHELRTPLTGILGFTEVLHYQMYGELNPKQLDAVLEIETSGKRLLQLINNVLDYTRLVSGRLHLQPGCYLLADICRSSLQTVQGKARAKAQQLDFSIEPDNLTMDVDLRRIQQIIGNLLDNAIKFTPQAGRIDLGVSLVGAQICLRISDTGIGIAAEDFPRLFEPFVQIDSRLAREYDGAGLGLALVKALAEQMGGGISVESTPGQGSIFTVMLPRDGREC